MAKIANYKIDAEIRKLNDFTNYNGTINGFQLDGKYVVYHWATKIFQYDIATEQIEYLATGFISQTTSTLVGRIVRAIPQSAVIGFATLTLDRKGMKRLLGMARVR